MPSMLMSRTCWIWLLFQLPLGSCATALIQSSAERKDTSRINLRIFNLRREKLSAQIVNLRICNLLRREKLPVQLQSDCWSEMNFQLHRCHSLQVARNPLTRIKKATDLPTCATCRWRTK